MKFSSTRGGADLIGFRDAVFRGLAPDGGLYQPRDDLDLKRLFLSLTAETSYADIAAAMIHALSPEDFDEDSARELAGAAYTFRPEIISIRDGLHLLDLTRGPSCAFKDFGASFLAATIERYLTGTPDRAVILTATSGDTGSAVAQAFHGRRNIDVVILYPSGRVSPLQEKQLTTVGGNVTALEVAGSFDDCQRMVKEAFVDPELRERVPLTSANSINLGRLLPQSFYYVYAFSLLKAALSEELYFCVPSGNYGNLTAGVFAWKWGLPVTGFIAASNRNSVVPEYLLTGVYEPRPSVRTYSNAMDVGDPSNFERLRAIFGHDWKGMRTMLYGRTVTDEETLDAIRRYHDIYGLYLDPHTAVGLVAAEQCYAEELSGAGDVIVLRTADAAKFSEIVEKAIGTVPPIPERLAAALDRKKEAISVPNTLDALKELLFARY